MSKPRRMITSRESLMDAFYELTGGFLSSGSIHSGRVVNLGWHCQVAGSKYPGWVIKYTTRFGRIHYVAVISDTDKYENRCYELTSLAGCVYYGGDSELYKGDV